MLGLLERESACGGENEAVFIHKVVVVRIVLRRTREGRGGEGRKARKDGGGGKGGGKGGGRGGGVVVG